MGNFPWTVTEIDLGYNSALNSVGSNAFRQATSLTLLKMWAASSAITFESNALYITNAPVNTTFEAYFYGSNDRYCDSLT